MNSTAGTAFTRTDTSTKGQTMKAEQLDAAAEIIRLRAIVDSGVSGMKKSKQMLEDMQGVTTSPRADLAAMTKERDDARAERDAWRRFRSSVEQVSKDMHNDGPRCFGLARAMLRSAIHTLDSALATPAADGTAETPGGEESDEAPELAEMRAERDRLRVKLREIADYLADDGPIDPSYPETIRRFADPTPSLELTQPVGGLCGHSPPDLYVSEGCYLLWQCKYCGARLHCRNNGDWKPGWPSDDGTAETPAGGGNQ